MITIIDYGLGNLASLKNIIKKVGGKSIISSDLGEIEKAGKLLLPGVGNFEEAIKRINNSGLRDILNKKVLVEKTPIMGVCLGMQIMASESEEGKGEGLGWFDAKVTKFKFSNNKIKVPHMGWEAIQLRKNTTFSAYYEKISPKFYFVHSYHIKCSSPDDVLAESIYGGEIFESAIQKDNIIGVQFHPEKSHNFGMKWMQCFIEKF